MRQQIVDRRYAGSGRAGADLDRRRLAGEGGETISQRIAGQIDENIDLIGLHLLAKLLVGQLHDIAPSIGAGPKVRGEFVVRDRSGIAGDFEPRLVVAGQHRPEGQGSGVEPEIAGDIANPDTPVRIAAVVMLQIRLCRGLRANVLPPIAARLLLLFDSNALRKFQREDPVGNDRLEVGSDRQRPVEIGKRFTVAV